jgi:hypothetical protein
MNRHSTILSAIIMIAAAFIVAAGLSPLLLQQHQAKAAILGDYQQGHRDGRSAAYNTYFAHGTFNDKCHGTISYCLGYEGGYGDEWNHLVNAFKP